MMKGFVTCKTTAPFHEAIVLVYEDGLMSTTHLCKALGTSVQVLDKNMGADLVRVEGKAYRGLTNGKYARKLVSGENFVKFLRNHRRWSEEKIAEAKKQLGIGKSKIVFAPEIMPPRKRDIMFLHTKMS